MRPALLGRASAGLLLALIVLLTSGCGRPQLTQQEAYVFGTQVQVTVAGTAEPEARAAIAAVLAEFDRLHRELHPWQPSELSRLNAALAEGKPFTTTQELANLLANAQSITLASDGLFDPGIGHLIALWGFQGDTFAPRLPEPDALTAWRKGPGSLTHVTLDGQTVRSTHRQTAIDLGGYAKGLALDRAAQILKGKGVAHALINIGGNVMALGDKFGQPWTVGIRHPRGNGYLASLPLHDGEAIGTSGDYQRFFELDGRRYSHLIDPRTAEPAQGTQALTLLIPAGEQTGLRSDALSKPLFLAGATGWSQMAVRLGVRQALRVDADGTISVTEELANRLTWADPTVPVTKIPLPTASQPTR